VGEAEV